MLPCSNLTTGIAKFTLGLQITRAKGKFLPGTPLRFTLRKECNLNRGMKSSTLDSTPALFQGSVLIFMLFSNLTTPKCFAQLIHAIINYAFYLLKCFLSFPSLDSFFVCVDQHFKSIE